MLIAHRILQINGCSHESANLQFHFNRYGSNFAYFFMYLSSDGESNNAFISMHVYIWECATVSVICCDHNIGHAPRAVSFQIRLKGYFI